MNIISIKHIQPLSTPLINRMVDTVYKNSQTVSISLKHDVVRIELAKSVVDSTCPFPLFSPQIDKPFNFIFISKLHHSTKDHPLIIPSDHRSTGEKGAPIHYIRPSLPHKKGNLPLAQPQNPPMDTIHTKKKRKKKRPMDITKSRPRPTASKGQRLRNQIYR